MTEPQVWTLIGVFGSALFAMFATTSSWFVRVIRSEVGGLRAEMTAKFERIDTRFDHLDRDVQALARRVFPERD